MTTLTSRPPLPLLPLTISPSAGAVAAAAAAAAAAASSSMTCNERSPSSSSSIGSISVSGGSRSAPSPATSVAISMHPDSIVIQGHGVTSPRLSNSSSPGSVSGHCLKNCETPPTPLPMGVPIPMAIPLISMNNGKFPAVGNDRDLRTSPLYALNENNIATKCDLNNYKVSDLTVSGTGAPSNVGAVGNFAKVVAYGSRNLARIDDDLPNSSNMDGDEDDITDRLSSCSEDSELSVGQECCDNNNSEHDSMSKNSNNNNSCSGNISNKNIHNLSLNSNCVVGINISNSNSGSFVNSSRHYNSNNSIMCNKQQMMDNDCESVDNCSSLSDDNRLHSGSGDHLASDELSNDSSPNRDVAMDPLMITAAAAASMRVPPIVRPSPTRLQEEILRKSHLYAEELMKQQMQFMAAARASAFSLRHGMVAADIGKVGFRPHVKQTGPSDIGENLMNFSGIHSHLNAISKMSNQIGSNESALGKMTTFGLPTSREPSQSPPSFHNLQPNNNHHQQHHHLQHHPFMNNNLNESSLKFSIDNILKADFGRRITDPILKRSGGIGNSNTTGKGSGGRKGGHHHRSNDRGATDRNSNPIDLTNVPPLSTCTSPGASIVSTAAGSLVSNAINVHEKFQRLSAEKSPPPRDCPTSAGAAVASSVSTSISTTSSQSSTSSSQNSSTSSTGAANTTESNSSGPMVWPAWVYCTRYSDRPSSGPRTRKPKKPPSEKGTSSSDEKRPRTAFSGPQLARLKHEFSENRYLTERRRQQLSAELGLNEAQIKIWFQNKRAKIKKATGTKNPLALQLMAQGLYNHSTVPLTREEEELQELQAKSAA